MDASQLHQREVKKIISINIDENTRAESIKSETIKQLQGASTCTSTNSHYFCDEDHSCDRCKFSTTTSTISIKEHLMNIRDGWDTFNCEICTFSTFCHDTLQKHGMEVHMKNDDYYDSKYEKYEKQRATSGSRFSMNSLKYSFSVGYDCAYVLVYYVLMVVLFVATGVTFVYLYYFYRHTAVFLFKIHTLSGTLPVNSTTLNQTLFMINKN